MKPIHSAVLLVVLTACGASKQSAPAPSSPPGGGPDTAMAPTTTAAAPASPGEKESKGAPPPIEGGNQRSTSPTADGSPGGDGPTAGPSRRLEDMKTEKTTATGGTYQVRVLSAAGLVPDEVGKSVNAAASKTDSCYSQALKKKVPPGAILYELNVNAQGTAAVKATSDTIKDTTLNKCIEDTLKKITWPKPTEKAGGKTTIEFAVPTT